MTPKQIAAIERTSDVLTSVDGAVVKTFYACLFNIAPDTRRLFPRDMSVQEKKLGDTLASLVGNLPNGASFADYLERLGRRHAGLGVTEAHYGPVAIALLFGLQQALGPRFTHEVREVWTALYVEIQEAMLRGAREASGEAP